MALLIAAVLVISHFSWLAILRMDRRQQQIDYSVEQMIFQLDSIQRALDATPPLPLPSLVEVAANRRRAPAPQAGRRPRRLVEQFTRRLPPGPRWLEDELSTPRLWIKLPKRNRWIAMPILFVHNPPPDNRLLPGVVLVVGWPSSLRCSWRGRSSALCGTWPRRRKSCRASKGVAAARARTA
jgi:two-component system osmolarity sensor histidine kinase EnvZ